MEELINILEEIRPDIDFEVEDSLVDDGILESSDIVAIVGELSDAYGVDIDIDELTPENLNSAEAMIDLIRSLQ